MHKLKLKNSLTVLLRPRKTNTTAVNVTVKVGSNNETDRIRGISHFIEHMLFEGTKTRTARQIPQTIEGIGGEISAFTTNEKTCFFVKSLNMHLDKAIEVLSDMIQNSLFADASIEKERKIIMSEVSFRNDEPRDYQWTLFQKKLFRRKPARHPIIGYEKTIKNIRRRDIISYHSKYYTPQNIIVAVSGDTKTALPLIKRSFSFKKGKTPVRKDVREPQQKGVQRSVETRQISHSYMVLGYKAVPRDHHDSYVLDVIQSILGKPLSGRLFDEFRNKRGLAYNVGAHNEAGLDYGFFALYISTEKKNISISRKIFLQGLAKVSDVSRQELEEAKNYIEGQYVIGNEDSQKEAENLAEWEMIGGCRLSEKYIERIRKVTKQDIERVSQKYFTKNYTIALLKQKD